MKTRIVFYLVLMLFTVLAHSEADPIGIVKGISGVVFVKSSTTGRISVLNLNQSVYLQDTILTNNTSRALILLKDHSSFTIGVNAEAPLNNFVYEQADGTWSLVRNVTRGGLRFIGGKLPSPKRMPDTSQPQPAIGIRG